MDGTFYFYFGAALVAAALVLAFIGIRGKDSFPPSRGALTGLAIAFAALVVGTGAFAIANAREEADDREQELAGEEEAAAPEQEGGAAEGGAGKGGEAGGGGGAAEALDVASPEDGSLSFEPDGLEAKAGTITLAYENPSPVPHNINIEAEDQTVAESEDVTAGSVEISAELVPGEYVFYCSIPGHRESGMEGTLTVQ